MGLINKLQDLLDATRAVDWLAPLALRLYLDIKAPRSV